MKRSLLGLSLVLSACAARGGPGLLRGELPSTRAPIDRAGMRAFAETRGFKLGAPDKATPTPDGKAVLFLRSGAKDPKQSLFETDMATGATKEIASPDKLGHTGETLTPEEKARRERMRVHTKGFTSFEISPDGTRVLLPLAGRIAVLTRATGELKEIPSVTEAIDPRWSPDGKRIAFVQKFDLFTVGADGRELTAITKGGSEAKSHGLAEFVASEEFDRFRGFWWSPDGAKIAYEEADCSKVSQLAIADVANPDKEPHRARYPRAGEANCELRFGIVPSRGGQTTWIDLDNKRFPYVATVTWSKSGPLTLYALDRAQRNGLLVSVDASTGKTTALLEERDAAWLNVDPSVPRWLADGSAFVWSTERDGQYRLELHDTKGTGKPLTLPDFGYRSLLHVDSEKKIAYVEASADPASVSVFAVPFDGSVPKPIAKNDQGGTFTGSFGEGHDVFVVTESSALAFPKTFARDIEGHVRWEIPRVTEYPPIPHVQIAQVAPVMNTRVAIIRPKNFVSGRKYPVIDAAYGGPGVNTVQQHALYYIRAQWMADVTGAIVVCIDAKGTPGRGREWERALAGKFGALPIEGHIATLRALGAALPEFDTSRVGIFGWSYGGYLSAYAVIAHPEFYRVGAAGAPVTEWRDYDTAYTERYLGQPQADGAAYDAASLVHLAKSPGTPRPLLLVHGTADDNVFFTHSLKLADALTRSGRPFEFLPLTGTTHMLYEPELTEMTWARVAQFLRDGLAQP